MATEDKSAALGPEAFNELAEKLAKVGTDPAFLEMLRELEAAAPDERETVATRLVTLDGLRERGIQVDDPDFRFTTRYFENPEPSKRGDKFVATTIDGTSNEGTGDTMPPVEAADSSLTYCFSVGAVYCASVGKSVDVSFPPLPPPIIHEKSEHFDPS